MPDQQKISGKSKKTDQNWVIQAIFAEGAKENSPKSRNSSDFC